jgi:hypothetical protein
LTKLNLIDLKRSIINTTDKTFNLGYNTYGSKWEFSFRKKVIENF